MNNTDRQSLRVVSCLFTYNQKILLLHRLPHKIDGGTWGLPSGKVDEGETDITAIQRELFEETGYQATEQEFTRLGEHLVIDARNQAFQYISFKLIIDHPHSVVLEQSAHDKYQWATINEAYQLPDLIHGQKMIFEKLGLARNNN